MSRQIRICDLPPSKDFRDQKNATKFSTLLSQMCAIIESAEFKQVAQQVDPHSNFFDASVQSACLSDARGYLEAIRKA